MGRGVEGVPQLTRRKFVWLVVALLGFLGSLPAFGAGSAATDQSSKAQGSNARSKGIDSTDVTNLLAAGEFDVSLRYRFEHVDQDGFSSNANASTLKSRLSFQSGDYRKFGFFVEVDDVHQVGADNYNAGAGNTPSSVRYPVIADPEGTEVNQLYLDYQATDTLRLRAGRQRINLDNQRFVGAVGWRQNEQTFDALQVRYANGGVTGQYAYVNKVRRIFGPDVAPGTHDQDGTHLLNLAAVLEAVGTVSAYYYHIDNEDAAAASTRTMGLRLTGNRALSETLGLRYGAEFADQSDVGSNPGNWNANYYAVDLGLVAGKFDVGVGQEVLEGNQSAAGEAFRTPLATLHAFNGWADKFLATPAAGLEDRYVKLKATPGRAIIQLRYHDFDAQNGGADFGDEINLQLGYKINEQIRCDLYFADYDAAAGTYTDTQKMWLMVQVNL